MLHFEKLGLSIANLLGLKPNEAGHFYTVYGYKSPEDLTKSIIRKIRYTDDYVTEFANFADFIRACCFKSYGYWFINSQTKPKSGEEAANNGMTSEELYKYYLSSEHYKPYFV